MKVSLKNVVIYLALLNSLNAHAAVDVHWGVAKDSDGSIVYTERHSMTSSSNGVLKTSETEYFDSKRKKKIGTLRSNYTRSLSLPTYEFVDLRTGYKEGLRFVEGKYLVYYQKPKEAEVSRELSDGKSVFSCQGWHYYLIENLKIIEKQDIALNLVLPSELDFYSFKIEKSAIMGDKIVANLELSNWLLSFFAPKLRLVYDKKNKKLLEFEGISNILDQNGDRQEVTIQYEYKKDA